jgi:hypothetical protein
MDVINRSLLITSAGLLLVSGCSAGDTPLEKDVAARAPASEQAAAAASGPATDPCGVLTTAEVRRMFPDAGVGKLDRSMEKYGMTTCIWDHPGGRFSAQFFSGEQATVDDEVRSRASAFLDPTSTAKNVRYETLDGIGDRAVAAIERSDQARGILSDFALLVVQRGERQVAFMSTQLATRDRGAALDALAELGRAAARRL